MYSDIDISFSGTRTVLGFNGVDTAMVPVCVPNEQAACANASGDLNVNYGPLVNFFAIFVPNHLWNWSSSNVAVESDVFSSFQGEHLIRRPFNLWSN